MEREELIQKMTKEYSFTTEQAKSMYETLKEIANSENDFKSIEERVRETLRETQKSHQFTLDFMKDVKQLNASEISY